MNSNRRQADADSAGESQRIVREAGEWRARQDAGAMNTAAEAEFLHWLERDPRHAEVYMDMDATWRILDRVREISPEAVGVAETGVMARHPGVRRTSRWMNFAPPLMAAAAIALLCTIAWRASTSTVRAPSFSAHAKAEMDAPKRMDLPDGSVVRLNAGTELSVQFLSGERRVELSRGEAYFTVAKNQQPFVVVVGGVDVRAVGTAFNVRMHERTVEVLVTGGKVGVHDRSSGESLLPATMNEAVSSQPPAVLVAGTQAIVALDRERAPDRVAASVAHVAEVEIQQALAWQDVRLEFESASLEEIVSAFNRHNHHRLVIADPALARLRLGGSFRADEPATFVHLIETRPGIVIERGRDATVLRSSK